MKIQKVKKWLKNNTSEQDVQFEFIDKDKSMVRRISDKITFQKGINDYRLTEKFYAVISKFHNDQRTLTLTIHRKSDDGFVSHVDFDINNFEKMIVPIALTLV